MRVIVLSGLLLCGAALLGCEDDLAWGPAPLIEAIRPPVAAPGGTITLVGRRFGLQGPLDAVYLGGQEARIASWADRAIRVQVPEDGRRGQLEVVVKTEGLVSRPVPFEIVSLEAADGGDPADLGPD